MSTVNKIDQLITQLIELKPTLVDETFKNEKKFNELLKSALDDADPSVEDSIRTDLSYELRANNVTPNWVDADYSYVSENPRKPNMREFIEAITGKSVKELYSEPTETWQSITNQASELLHGVVGSNKDTRNWPEIMGASDVLTAAKSETGKMYEPKIEIDTYFDDNGFISEQVAVLKDKDNTALRTIPKDIGLAEAILKNFGATRSSVPSNLESKIISEKFDKDLQKFLTDYDKNIDPIENVALENATDAISKRLSANIPFEELAKL